MHLQKMDILKNETVKLTKTAKRYVQYMMKKNPISKQPQILTSGPNRNFVPQVARLIENAIERIYWNENSLRFVPKKIKSENDFLHIIEYIPEVMSCGKNIFETKIIAKNMSKQNVLLK